MPSPNDLVPHRPDLVPDEVFAPRPDLVPSYKEGERRAGEVPRPRPRPEQLELFDPYDDGLDFGTWMRNLPRAPHEAHSPTRAGGGRG